MASYVDFDPEFKLLMSLLIEAGLEAKDYETSLRFFADVSFRGSAHVDSTKLPI